MFLERFIFYMHFEMKDLPNKHKKMCDTLPNFDI